MNDNGPSPVLKLLNTRYVQVFSSNVVHVYGRGLRSTEVRRYFRTKVLSYFRTKVFPKIALDMNTHTGTVRVQYLRISEVRK
jgi:hypothetical protein